MRTKKSPPPPPTSPSTDNLVPAKLLPFVVDAGRRVRPLTECRVLPFITKQTYDLRKWTLGWCAYRQILADQKKREQAERMAELGHSEPNGPGDGNK
jgi:hypothetical protein